MKFFPLIWSNLRRRKLRTILTISSILVAFLLYGFLCALKNALGAGVSMTHADRLITRQKVSLIQPLPQSYQDRILHIPGVAAAAHQTWFGGIYQDPKNFFPSMPVVPEEFLAMYPEFVLPADQKKKWLETRTGAIVGRATATRFGWKIGDHVPLTSPIWGQPANQPAWDFEIVGIFDGANKSTDTSQLFFRYDYFDEARASRKGEVGWYTIRIANPDTAAATAAKVDEEFANSPYETKTEPEAAFVQGFAQQIGDIGTILISILGTVFFTIVLVAGNTMAQAVRERTTELGALKAMGFGNQLIMILVLAESGLIAALGGLTGLGLAWLFTIRGSPVPSILPIFFVPPHDYLVGLALMVGLGFAAGLVPAAQAMRLPVAVALRRHQ